MNLSIERLAAMTELPFELRKVFANLGEPNPEVHEYISLWRDVVARLTLDAMGYTGFSEIDKHSKAVNEAQRWFLYSKDCAEVFALADIPLETTRHYVIQNFALTKGRKKNTRESAKEKRDDKVHKARTSRSNRTGKKVQKHR